VTRPEQAAALLVLAKNAENLAGSYTTRIADIVGAPRK
jgi:hypothetical protein